MLDKVKKKEIVGDNRNCLHTWNVLVTSIRWNWLSQFLLQLIKLLKLPCTAQWCIHEVCVVEATVINLVSLSFFIVQNHRLKSMAPEHFTWQIWWSCLCVLTSWLYSSCITQSSMLKHYCQQHHPLSILFNPLNPELNPICYLLALLGAHHFLHVSRIRVKLLILRRVMSYIYGAPILDVSRSHTTTQHSR